MSAAVPGDATRNIAVKLVKIMAAVGSIEKKGKNRAQQYDFVRETDLVDKVRPLMAELGLFLNLNVISHELIEMGRTSSGSTMRLTILAVNGTWIDAETGDTWAIPATFYGYGADAGDKGVYKAMTGAEKYLLFKSFLVSTGDDPEGDEKTDRTPTTRRIGPPRIEGAVAGDDVARGGRQAKASVAQLRMIASLLSQTQITPEGFRRLIGRETGAAPPEGPLNRWLGDQPAGLVGKIINALTNLASIDPDEDEGPDRDSGREGAEGGYGDDDLPLV